MMKANDIRQAFKDFFASKQHEIVDSAPMVVKNDPTLMFVNAGMNQFKDQFLGQKEVRFPRVANSQKCLRVSGKHNDLEEVGHDTYHHTMFEMLGNWSFGDYFKKEAIDWAWELLTDVFKISPERLYATVFEGDSEDDLPRDDEAAKFWNAYLPEGRILNGSKKDNFWEMGATGPCGPCSEIHIDLRSEEERKVTDAVELINQDHPQVIEIWNLVFMQFNRLDSGELKPLPAKHVDTGMGFERLCMALQDKTSNYDTDVFQPIIQEIASISGKTYGKDEKTDIAMRVVADHLRAVAFAIADGQLPSNNKAGYVIRRILRRAIRYAYTFLGQSEPFISKLVKIVVQEMGDAFTELKKQEDIVTKVIHEEESTFLRTLETGISLLDKKMKKLKQNGSNVLDGKSVFELYDTYGFPTDLTALIAKENGYTIDEKGFEAEMKEQKDRSRSASKMETKDWTILNPSTDVTFKGYESTSIKSHLLRYRKIKAKGKDLYQLVFAETPFYAESGGQVGDTGYIEIDGQKISIIDTQSENNLTMHFTKELPENTEAEMTLVVSESKRRQTEANHTATHLLHYALRKVLGEHVEQKGSLVEADRFRFDFAHFEKMTREQIEEVEDIVNSLIQQDIPLNEQRNVEMKKAEEMGAMALFGEKYGDRVRVIQFGDSVELCGGTHVSATGKIGLLIVTVETAIAAGIRRIEAITGKKALEMVRKQQHELAAIGALFNNQKNLAGAVEKLQEEHTQMQKALEEYAKEKAMSVKNDLLKQKEQINDINVIAAKVDVDNAGHLKDLSFQLKNEVDNLFLVLGSAINGKANLSIMISENLVKEKDLHAGNIIREAAKEMKGGGGGQPFFASAGGKDPEGIQNAIDKALTYVK
ncbi:Alanine--tRNA ligase [Salinivirga cyanobacteriivorans]|uniref:Alanine--tRNA ligase n=1 Tax=Salinivirga cyanobacteriivorans TaxID=1307839 RepID=A0A0S2I313_9BACT|nr:alanine--tRNA ligase [Salinivirga cyanobacteriivorans]ALO16640.1 Alanine--tRNA ligase [Salinivirga cyanobacteriivorans]